ncbi:MAG: uroporphyrin-III C-methyltransferase [Candidatus Azotimanducaceae bacterium]|jgi:uroporphyrin-III C-methyltransferase
MTIGTVHLVGAGPGAADLITLRGIKCLQRAEVVVYDRLVSRELLDYTVAGCEKIYVGKRKNLHVMSQTDICLELVKHARLGKRVVRLKGGDPFIFGRGGEEVDALVKADIPWEVVPGVTAASGVAASLGMPLTHRDESQAITFVTAHRKHGEFDFDWSLALHNNQTVVFYMALSCASDLVAELLTRGKDPLTLFTIAANGTWDNERFETCLLKDAEHVLSVNHFSSPALLVMGPKPRVAVETVHSQLDDLAVRH